MHVCEHDAGLLLNFINKFIRIRLTKYKLKYEHNAKERNGKVRSSGYIKTTMV